MSKRKNCKRHFKRRMRERHGLWVNNGDLKKIVGAIQGGNCKLIQKQSNRVSVYEIEYEGKELSIVYDHMRSVPVTVLPE
jgi:hypothetical protein